jgi:transposase
MLNQNNILDFTGNNIYAGIDVHKKSWKVSIYSDDLYHKSFTQPPNPEILSQYLFKNFPNGTYYSVYEAGFCGFWIHNKLVSSGINNIVVNPADVPTTDHEKKYKTDKIDSHKLAKQLRNGDLNAIFIHEEKHLEDRYLVRTRRTISKELTRYKNRIKSQLLFWGIKIPTEIDRINFCWSRRFINWLDKIELSYYSGTESFKFLLNQYKTLRQDLLHITRKIRELSISEYYQPKVTLLMSIPGIGMITAMTILTEINDINRFKNLDRFASYVGITPTNHSSGEREIHGEMVNRGNNYLKPIIIECSWIAAKRDPILHKTFIELSKRMNRNQAIVRIARKLLNRISFVLKKEEKYSV